MTAAWHWLRAHATDTAVGIALAVVVVSTGFISYTHICALTLDLHQSWKTAHLTPLAIDGQIVIGSFVWARLPGRARWCGLAGIVPGLAESMFANWESGISHGHLAAGWAMVAAEAFAVSSFLFELWLKYRSGTRIASSPDAIRAASPAGLRTAGAHLVLSPDATSDAPDPVTLRAQLNGHATKAERLFAADVEAGQVPGIRRIQQQLHVGQPKARLVQEHLRTLTQTS